MKNKSLKITLLTISGLTLCNPLLAKQAVANETNKNSNADENNTNLFAKDFLDTEEVIYARRTLDLEADNTNAPIRNRLEHNQQSPYEPARVRVVLDPGVLTLVDGKIFVADTLEMLLGYQRDLMNILIGLKQNNNTARIGKYSFNGKKYGAFNLALLEKNQDALSAADKDALRLILQQAKEDLMAASEVFRAQVRGAKAIITALAEESCSKRNRLDSVLIHWCNLKNLNAYEENKLFEKHITNFSAFLQLSSDIYNFLTDVINSCPKAQEQYRTRVEKFKKLTQLLPSVLDSLNKKNIDKTAFLSNFKRKHIDNLMLEHITQEKIKTLVTEFLNQQK